MQRYLAPADELNALRRAVRNTVIAYLWCGLVSLPRRFQRCGSQASASGCHCFCRQ